jgi:glycosyltransferase involved in cell wall biosynthesis
MLGAMDCFILPSLYEGFPLAAIEAQAAGLPVAMSDVITPEAMLHDCITERVSLARSPAVWASVVVRMCNGPRVSAAQAMAGISDSPFNIDRAHHVLEDVYRTLGAPRATAPMTEAA